MDKPIQLDEGAEPRRRRRRRRHAATAPPCTLTFGETCGLRHAVVGNGLLRAEILLDKGANIRQLWHVPSGARTLAETIDWREQLAAFHAARLHGSSYSDFYEGGYQDVLPARARGARARARGADRSIGDDVDCIGEAAIVPWEVMRCLATPAGIELVCRAAMPRAGLYAVKRFRLRRGDARLRVETTVRNARAHDVSFSWTQHPALGGDLLTAGSRVWLPERRAGITRLDGNASGNGNANGNGNGSGDGDGDHREVTFRSCGAGWTSFDLLLPPPGDPDRFLTFAGARTGEAALASSGGGGGVGVRLRWDLAKFPHLWLWCARRDAITCVAPEPSTTYLPELGPRPGAEILRMLKRDESVSAWLEFSVFAPVA